MFLTKAPRYNGPNALNIRSEQNVKSIRLITFTTNTKGNIDCRLIGSRVIDKINHPNIRRLIQTLIQALLPSFVFVRFNSLLQIHNISNPMNCVGLLLDPARVVLQTCRYNVNINWLWASTEFPRVQNNMENVMLCFGKERSSSLVAHDARQDY